MFRTTAFAILLALTIPAAAQTLETAARPTPALKRAVTVTSDLVRIGDLVENAGPTADIAIFRSPDPGTTGTVSAASVLAAVRAHALVDVDARGVTAIEVTRASRTISPEDITDRITRAFAGRYGLGKAQDLSITYDEQPRAIEVDPSVTADLRPLRSYYDRPSRRFDILFELPGTASRTRLRYSGSLVETVEAVVPVRPLARGEVIRSADVVVARRPKSGTGSDVIANMAQAVGLAVRHPLRSGQPVRRADLMRPELVQRGQTVTLIYEVPGIRLTVRGQALATGAAGDTVNVLNVQSKRTIEGTVSGPGRVTVSSPVARVAANVTHPTAFASTGALSRSGE